MKTVILCGGRGTRLGEHGTTVPKALIEIGGNPIIWHLMKYYSFYNLNEFILCLGYLGDKIKRYFIEHQWLNHDFTLNTKTDQHFFSDQKIAENWKITFADTDLETNTGGRIKKIEKYLKDEEIFCVTYGDGLSNVNLTELIKFHRSHGKIATLTAVHPFSNFGVLKLDQANNVTEFLEKPLLKEWINGGFFVFNRRIFDYLDANSILELEPFQQLAKESELMAFQHTGFWKCMDTFKDNIEFNQLWNDGKAGWKIW